VAEPFTHDRAFAELELVAVGAASPDVMAGVLAHAAECAECRAELDELTVLFAALTTLVPPYELNRGRAAGIRSRLMARADADMEAAAKRRVDAAAKKKESSAMAPMGALPGWERMVRVPERPTGEVAARPTPRAGPQHKSPDAGAARSRLLLPLGAIIATLALLGVAAAAFMLWPDGDEEPVSASTQVAELEARVDSLEVVIAAVRGDSEALVAPEVAIVDLVSYASGGRPLARVFWNTIDGRLALHVYELRPPRVDHIHQLWAQTTQGRISAGTFLPTAEGIARMDTSFVLPVASVRSMFITEEPGNGSRQPTGRTLAAGSL
jgi:hypothetical protein